MASSDSILRLSCTFSCRSPFMNSEYFICACTHKQAADAVA
jgi:hypothetical protein